MKTYTEKEAKRVLNNPMTKQLIEWLPTQKAIAHMLVSPAFFHASHTKRDREVLCIMIENFFNCEVKRTGNNAVSITF